MRRLPAKHHRAFRQLRRQRRVLANRMCPPIASAFIGRGCGAMFQHKRTAHGFGFTTNLSLELLFANLTSRRSRSFPHPRQPLRRPNALMRRGRSRRSRVVLSCGNFPPNQKSGEAENRRQCGRLGSFIIHGCYLSISKGPSSREANSTSHKNPNHAMDGATKVVTLVRTMCVWRQEKCSPGRWPGGLRVEGRTNSIQPAIVIKIQSHQPSTINCGPKPLPTITTAAQGRICL